MIRFHQKNNTQEGFTLTELLVVIAIIGILASVVLASLNGARAKGRDTKRVSDVKSLQLALEFYYDANSNEYPDALDDLSVTYIATIPKDPTSDADYDYEVSSGNDTYVLRATLENPNDVLNEDLDDTQEGLDCNDSGFRYCLGP